MYILVLQRTIQLTRSLLEIFFVVLLGNRSAITGGSKKTLVIYETSFSELEIIQDISCTFPSYISFQQRNGPGQRSLYNILKAYSVYDRDVGYMQGMEFLVGFFLLCMSEEDAFWLLVALLKGAIHAPM